MSGLECMCVSGSFYVVETGLLERVFFLLSSLSPLLSFCLLSLVLSRLFLGQDRRALILLRLQGENKRSSMPRKIFTEDCLSSYLCLRTHRSRCTYIAPYVHDVHSVRKKTSPSRRGAVVERKSFFISQTTSHACGVK